MTTSLYIYQLQKSVSNIIFDKNFDPNSTESTDKLKKVFDKFQEQTERLTGDKTYGDKIYKEGEAYFSRVMKNLDQFPSPSKRNPPMNPNQKV